MDFRLAAADDANKIATLLTDVFANYNMYRTVLSKHFTADSKYIDFLNKMHYVQAKSNIRKGYCLVAEEDDNIIAVAILQDLSKTRITVWDYIRSGALDLPENINTEVINTIKEKTMIFAYYNDAKYLKTSKYLNVLKLIDDESVF